MNLLHPKFDPKKDSIYLPREINLLYPQLDSGSFYFGKKNKFLTAVFILTFTLSMTLSSLGVSADSDSMMLNLSHITCDEDSVEVHFVVVHLPESVSNYGQVNYIMDGNNRTAPFTKRTGGTAHYSEFISAESGTYNVTAGSVVIDNNTINLHNPTSVTVSCSPEPSITPTPSPTPSVTPAPTPSVTPTPTPSATPTPTPTPAPTPTATPTPTPCLGNSLAMTQYNYVVQNISYDYLGNHINAGDQVTVNFTLTGCGSKTLSFVSYNATSDFSLAPQTVFSSDTHTYEVGEHMLNIVIPPCYYQVDFVYGEVIIHFNPPQDTYSAQNRFIDGTTGGNACVVTPTPTPEPTPTPTPTPSPTPESTPTPSPSPSPTVSESPAPTPSTTPTPNPTATPTPTSNSGGGGGGGGGGITGTFINGPLANPTVTPPPTPQVLGKSTIKILPATGASIFDRMLFSLFAAMLLTGTMMLFLDYEFLPEGIIRKLE